MQKPTGRPAQNRQMIKYDVRNRLQGHVFMAFLACLLPTLVSLVMRLIKIPGMTINFLVADAIIYQFSWPMMILSFVATTLLTDPMGVKLSAFFLTLNRDPEHLPSPLSVCDCFGPGYWRLVSGMLQRAVRILIFSAIPLLLLLVIPGAYEVLTIQELDVIRLSDWSYWAVLAALGVNIYVGLGYSMVPYLLADNPGLSASGALSESLRMTRGRRWELFVMQLSFFGWLLLVSVTLMIGAVYVYPYIEGTMAAYYLAFSKPMPWEPERIEGYEA